MEADYLKLVFRWLHIIWAIIGFAASIMLASAKGHPPGLVFVPVVLAIWIIGHGLFWISRKLVIKGKLAADNRNTTSGRWPLLLVLLVFLVGAVFMFGVFGLTSQVLAGKRWGIELISMALIWLGTTLSFFGILLRQNWARFLIGGGFVALALILLYEMIASFARGYKNSLTEWVTAIVLFILLVLIAQYVLRSSRIKAFFAG